MFETSVTLLRVHSAKALNISFITYLLFLTSLKDILNKKQKLLALNLFTIVKKLFSLFLYQQMLYLFFSTGYVEQFIFVCLC